MGSRSSSASLKEEGPSEKGIIRTFIAEKRVRPIAPKYTAVKGSRGPEIRCFAYVNGPIRTAHEARNRTEPKDHLCRSLMYQYANFVFQKEREV